ncbi:MAG: flavodoxin [Firmicutes bacterium]|nr:flavodoxin [Bacillota bacterium]
MKTAIVYYSMFGNSEYVAGIIASMLDADVIRLEPEKAYPTKGLRKFIHGGKSAIKGETPKLKPYEFDGEKYDRVILGFPVWAGCPAPPIGTFIKENSEALKDKRLAAAVSFSGGGADKALAKLRELLGVDALEAELILVDPKTKPASKKEMAIKEFCEGLEQ